MSELGGVAMYLQVCIYVFAYLSACVCGCGQLCGHSVSNGKGLKNSFFWGK